MGLLNVGSRIGHGLLNMVYSHEPDPAAPVDPAAPPPPHHDGFMGFLGNVAHGINEGWKDYAQSRVDNQALRQYKLQSLVEQRDAMRSLANKWGLGGLGGLGGGNGGQPAADPGLDPSLGDPSAMPRLPTGSGQGERKLPSVREAAPDLAALAAAGADITDLLSVLDKSAPNVQVANGVPYDSRDPAVLGRGRVGVNLTNVNGSVIDTQDPKNANRFVPEVEKGQRLVYDEHGSPVGVMDLGGYTQSIERRAQAQAGGTEAGRAPYDIVTVDMPDGSKRQMTRSEAAQTLSGQGGSGGFAGAGGPGVGRSQTPADAEYAKGAATDASKRFGAMQTSAQSAQQAIPRYQQFASLLKDVENTGVLTPAFMAASSAANSIGVHVDPKLGAKQAADAIGSKLVLDLMGGSLGTGISNADRSYIEKMAPNLRQTPEGRQILVNTAVRSLQNQVEIAQMARQWQARYGRIDAQDGHGKGFDDYLNTWLDSRRIFK